MKNEHLLPVNVIDLVEKFNKSNGNEKMILLQRIETIRDYCDNAAKTYNSNVEKQNTNNNFFKKRK